MLDLHSFYHTGSMWKDFNEKNGIKNAWEKFHE